MNVPFFLLVALASGLLVNGDITGSDSLFQCSKFHFEEKVLEKLVYLEIKMRNHEKMIEKWTSDMKIWLEKIENVKQNTEQFVNVQKSDMDNIKDNLLQRMEKETDQVKYSIDTLSHNISDILVKLSQIKNDVKGIQERPSVAFSAYLTSVSPDGTDIVKFNNIWTNIGNAYNPITGVFTAPTNGLYSFTSVLLSQENKILFRHIFLNNEYLEGTYLSGNGHKAGTLSAVLNLNKNDLVYIKSKSSGYGGVYSGSNKYSTFSGFLIT